MITLAVFPRLRRFASTLSLRQAIAFTPVLAVGLLSPPTYAQVETADLLGSVVDPSGAIVPNANITVHSIDSGSTRTTRSNATGEWVVTALPVGRYAITVTVPGFKTYTVPEMVLSQGDRARISAAMQVGEAAETVTVGSTAPQLQTDSSVLGTVVTERESQDLPLNGRNFMELAQVLAGTNEGPPNALSSGQRPDDRRMTSSVSVNGQDENVNNQLIDGLDNNERIIGSIGVRPSIDAISEFRVQTNLYTAEVGRTAGAIINIITKSGTNKYHGSLYEFFRNDILDATDYFALTHTRLRQNQYGGSLGGPVLHDKLFFFADYEGFRQVAGHTYTTTVPTRFEEQNPGDFSDIKHTNVPKNAIDPIGLAYFRLYPAPNRSGTASNYTNSPNRTQFSHTGDARVDYTLPEGDRVFIRYTINQVSTFVPGTLPVTNGITVPTSTTAVDNISPGGNPFAYSGNSGQRAQNGQINYVHMFTPNLLGEFKVGYTRVDNASFPLNYGRNLSSAFGLTNANLGTLATSALTTMSPAGYASVGDGIFIPLENLDNTFQEAGQLTWTRGTQSIKIGAALIRRQAMSAQSSYPVGYVQFNTYTEGGAFGNVSCAPLGCLLRGLTYREQRVNQLFAPGFRTWEPSLYFQDDWRATSRLTLNLGIRYDVFTPFTESHGRLSNFDPTTASLLVAGQNGVSGTAGVATDYSNVAPRIGFAYSVTPKTVVRGGFGLTYVPTSAGVKTALGNAPYVFNYQSQDNTVKLSQGLPIPALVDPRTLYSSSASSFTLAGIDRHYRSADIEQFNLTVQRQLPKDSIVTISYVGELGRQLRLNPNLNLAPPATHGCTSPSTACYRPYLPFAKIYPNLTTANLMVSEGSSSYHALQAIFSKRFSHTFGINANYTYAHGLNDVANYALGSASNGVLPSQIATVDYGDSDLNVRHRFALLLNAQLPFGQRASGWKRAAIGGWQANAIFIYSTGLPFSVTDNTAYSNTGVSGGGERALQIGDPHAGTTKTIAEWFNTTAFTDQVFGTYVPSRRNLLYGPNYRTLNLSGFKMFPIRDRWTLQFRAEVFNLTNTPNFAQPDASVGDGSFGRISSTRLGSTPRQIQFALKLLF